MSISKKFAAGAAAVAVASGLAVVTSGTASAAPSRHCEYNRNTDAIMDLGIVHGGLATDDCGWLRPGLGIEGYRGHANSISLGHVTMPNGQSIVGFVDDPTGLYPVGGDGIW